MRVRIMTQVHNCQSYMTSNVMTSKSREFTRVPATVSGHLSASVIN